MAEATKTEVYHPTPGIKAYQITFSDGETLTTPFSTIYGAKFNYAVDPSTGNPIGYTKSAGVLTIECTGASSVAAYVEVNGF